MNETTVPVAEAARDFLSVLDGVERTRQPAILVRDGLPVATLNPLASPALTCAELAEIWPALEKLPPDEATAFADDVEQSGASLPSIKPKWD